MINHILSELAVSWDFTIPDIIVEGFMIATLLHLAEHFSQKKRERHLEEKLDELLTELKQLHEEERSDV